MFKGLLLREVSCTDQPRISALQSRGCSAGEAWCEFYHITCYGVLKFCLFLSAGATPAQYQVSKHIVSKIDDLCLTTCAASFQSTIARVNGIKGVSNTF